MNYLNSKCAEIWHKYKWQNVEPVLPRLSHDSPLQKLPKSNFNQKTLYYSLLRRSSIAFEKEPIAFELLSGVFSEIDRLTSQFEWLHIYIGCVAIEGLEDGVYLSRNEGLKFFSDCQEKSYLKTVQSQWWVRGAGLYIYLAVDWSTYIKGHPGEGGLHSLYISLGRVGQRILETAHEAEFKSRMTPAVSETLTKKILGIDEDNIEPLYHLRIGVEIDRKKSEFLKPENNYFVD